jgi:hypothetical protein
MILPAWNPPFALIPASMSVAPSFVFLTMTPYRSASAISSSRSFLASLLTLSLGVGKDNPVWMKGFTGTAHKT